MHRSLVRKIVAVAGSAGLVAAAVAASHPAAAEPGTLPPAEERRVLTTEHVDAINVGFDGERLTVDSKISPPVEHVAVDDLVFQLSDLGRVEGLPEQYAEFIGADTAWVIMQTQNPDVLWAGWSTEGLAAGVVDDDAVEITLTDVRGPGDLEVFQTGPFGEPIRVFSSDEDHKTLRQAVNAHVHANWAFTQPGVYTVTFTVAAAVDGEPVTSGPVDYTWVVGGEDGALPAPAPSAITVQAPQTAVVGEEVLLEADVTTDPGSGAPPAPGGWVEFHDGDTALGWAPLAEGRAELPVTLTEPGEHAVTATYTSQEPQFYAPATAEPVTVTVEDGDVEPPATTLTVSGPDGAVPAGEPLTLTATQDPPTGLTAYRWSTRAPGGLAFDPVDGATTGTLTVTPAAADDGRQYRAALYTDDGVHVAYSAPYTLAVQDAEPPGQCEDPRTMLTDEHADLLAPALDGDRLELRAKVGTAADHTYYDPADLLVQVKDPEAAGTVPAGAGFEFLGDAGDPLWMIPQTQNPDVVWAGWSTEDLAPGELQGDVVDMTLVDATGPGEVEVFQTTGLGAPPARIFSSADSLPARQQSVGQHVHANWAFTELGEYTLTFEVTGTLPSGATVTTGEVGYAVVVGDPECDPGQPGDENGADESGGDASGGDESGSDEGGGDATGGDVTGGDGGTDTGSTGGADAGDAGGTTPDPTTRPTTTPTAEVCVPRPSATTPAPGAPSAPGGTSGDPVVLTTEHVDLLAPVFESGALGLRAKVGSAADHTFYDPAHVLVQVLPAAESTVPGGDAYAFLGTAGAPLWLIPETQNPEVVWAGWSTEELAAGTFAGDAVDLRLVGAEGPGAVEVFQTTGFGDIARIFSSEESLPARQQSVGQHVHANWAFSAEGDYTLTFEVSGTTAAGETLTTGPVEYAFVVGESSGARNASPTPTATATPSPSPTPTPSATPSATSSGDECDLASTGTSATPGLTVLGGLLVAAGAVATAAYWRDRRAARG
ncbi:choice-of-anchor M domain-containing protein [Jiangella alkaliphila]|uniref:Surface-anchored protein n=1 Tax=Jiangella alkaliphila TaxID=419479 RepID=A0A1H2KJ96_9ACTN|nr:choice-of-anchor M domain-containing protein [Jiangella alkaliphila]SDU68486.1 surface-anchored protein [Jiangella alkaliphila]